MNDEHPDLGPDPLAGHNPHPREQIDLWPLHDARQDLLEEIVSQPGPGQSTSARRFAVPIGIAAALAIVGGGVWFVVATDDDSSGGKGDQIAASSEAPTDSTDGTTDDSTDDSTDDATDVATDPSTAATDEPSPPAEPTLKPLSELRKGDILGPKQCRNIRRGWADISVGDKVKRVREGKWTYLVLNDGKHDKTHWVRLIKVGKGNQFVGVGKDCTVTSVGRLPKDGPRG